MRKKKSTRALQSLMEARFLYRPFSLSIQRKLLSSQDIKKSGKKIKFAVLRDATHEQSNARHVERHERNVSLSPVFRVEIRNTLVIYFQ